MIILGIDTAMRCTGYGIISVSNGKFNAVDCGVIKNGKDLPHSKCLKRLSGGIKELISSYHIDAAAIEGAFYFKNIKTTMILGYARGCIMTTLAEADIPIFAYAPKEIKMAASGFGNASKSQIGVLVSSMLNIDVNNIEDDATDALAIAICHANRINTSALDCYNLKQI